jgi:hypothetical protein
MRASSRKCATQCRGVSTWPYIIVAVVGIPSPCAVVMTSTHEAAGSLPFVSTHRTSSSRISAAVPGSEPTPALFASASQSRIDDPVRAAPLTTSIGLNACTCSCGWRLLTVRAMSK